MTQQNPWQTSSMGGMPPSGGYASGTAPSGYASMNPQLQPQPQVQPPPYYGTNPVPNGYPTGPQMTNSGSQPPVDDPSAVPGFSYMPTGRGPRKSMRWWHWAIIGAAVLGMTAALILILVSGKADSTTAVIRQASLGEQYVGDALIVRDETVYDAEGVTRVEYVAEEGQLVRYNAEICRIFAAGYSTRDMTSLQDYRDQIRTYQRTLLTSETTIEGQRYAMESNVLQSVRQIREIIGGARGNLINQEQILTAAVRDRQTYIRSTYSNDQRLTRLLEDANVQEQRIDSVTRRAKAIEECIVSFYTDGYEYGLNMLNYNTFDPVQVRSMMEGRKPELTTTQRGRTAIYRTIRDNPWAVLMLADDQTWNPVEGQQFQMRLGTFNDDEVMIATVESFRRSGGELLVVLVIENDVSRVLDLRQSRVTLYDENTALIVPSKAIYVQDETEGVVVRTGGSDLFVPVTIIRRSGEDVYISPVTEGYLFEGLTVRLF
ncbi:MAG: hypothetical protein IK127_02260 [Clostridia bacterium]|nr:hypothetical protein [Clostridia bacterium]